MKHFKLLLALICASLFTVNVNAQLQLYSYTNQVDGYAHYVNPNMVADKLRRVKGAKGAGGGVVCPIGFTSKAFSIVDDYASDLPSVVGKITPNPGVSIQLTKISTEMRISSTGPIYVRLAYSVDLGVTWIDAGVDYAPVIADCGDASTYGEWNITGFPLTSGIVYIRVYAFNAINEFGRFTITNLNADGNLNMVDADGDGYGEYVDCDETNPDIHPGATEYCNDIDEDCNGIADEVFVAITPTGDIYLCNNEETVTLYGTEGYDSYVWYKNGNPIPVYTSSITVSNPGYYQVEATQGLCSALSAVQAVAVTESPFANIYSPDGLALCVTGSLKLKASFDELYNWQWFRDGSPIAGETDYKILVTIPGTYYCEVSTVFGCARNTAEVVVTPCRDGDNLNLSNMTAYPNPATNTVSFNINTGNSSSNMGQFFIFNMNGQQVVSLPANIANGVFNSEINISELPNGIYNALLINGGVQFTSRFTVSK